MSQEDFEKHNEWDVNEKWEMHKEVRSISREDKLNRRIGILGFVGVSASV